VTLRALSLILLITAACSMKDAEEQGAPGSAAPVATRAQPIELFPEDMPDASWNDAAKAAGQAWQESFAKINITKVTMTPVRSPDGFTVKYLMRARAYDARGVTAFDGVAVIHDGKLVNGGGAGAASRFFASIKYPTIQIPLGHLLEILDATRAVEPGWIRSPTKFGWDFTTLRGSSKHVPASVIYDADGALVTLFRDGKRQPGKPAPLEKLDVRIGNDGSVKVPGK
jgi:hypothetical protein